MPFCIKKCPYCDFYSVAKLSLKDGFLSALLTEISLREDPGSAIDTIYFGGGTPSLLTPGEIETILSRIRDHFNLAEGCEITLEVNPGTVGTGYFDEIRLFGVNRLNMGVQSLCDEKLGFMERIHSAKVAEQALLAARTAGFDKLGFDLIFGLPGETETSWRKDLDRALEFHPEHLSCYMLTYEPGTPMHGNLQAGRINPLGDETAAALFRLTSTHLEAHGYLHYEISNFAAGPEHRSRHNRKYWNLVPYLGFGPSAHSFGGNTRSWNHADVRRYAADLDQGVLPVAETENLTREQVLVERVMLGLRTSDGIDIKEFEKVAKRGFMEMFKDIVRECETRSWAGIENHRFILTLEGRLFLDTVTGLFAERIWNR
ncbi:MAG: radical SAM family heme chaperone HemW [Desulfobacteraceae bacterium]|nr:radical SAM family heme chaperone HemW [Desulfobacteraceae bacterium]